MPKYYFHIRNLETDAIIPDAAGVDLPDLQSARAEALQLAREIIIEAIRTERCVDGCRFLIADADGNTVLTFSFEQAVKFVRKPNGSTEDER